MGAGAGVGEVTGGDEETGGGEKIGGGEDTGGGEEAAQLCSFVALALVEDLTRSMLEV
jgi:hypothetical protein